MFSDQIKLLRTNSELTQVEFAKVFNIATGTIAMWETGKRQPDYETLTKLADHFNVTVDYLLGRDTEPKKIHPSETDERILKLTSQYKEAGQLFDLFPQLSPDQQKTILDLAQVYIAQQEKDNRE